MFHVVPFLGAYPNVLSTEHQSKKLNPTGSYLFVGFLGLKKHLKPSVGKSKPIEPLLSPLGIVVE
jgi:hypothetical protein